MSLRQYEGITVEPELIRLTDEYTDNHYPLLQQAGMIAIGVLVVGVVAGLAIGFCITLLRPTFPELPGSITFWILGGGLSLVISYVIRDSVRRAYVAGYRTGRDSAKVS